MRDKIKGVELFNKGDEIFALISSTSNPNLLMPIRCQIMDIEHADFNHKYAIKILEMYDDIEFLQKHFLKQSFWYAHRSSKNDPNVISRVSQNKAGRYDIKTKDDLYNVLHGKVITQIQNTQANKYNEYEERHYLLVESIFCFATKYQMDKAFNDVTDFWMYQLLEKIKTATFRLNYNGYFKNKSNEKLLNAVSLLVGRELMEDEIQNINEILNGKVYGES